MSGAEKSNRPDKTPRWLRPVELPDDLREQLCAARVADPGLAPEILVLLLLHSPVEDQVLAGRALARHLMPHLPDGHPFFDNVWAG